MHAVTQSSILFLWMITLTFVKSQDCTLQQFLESPQYDEHFDTSNLDAVYSARQQVRVDCKPGYTGFFQMICAAGMWLSRGNRCERIKCRLSHPTLGGATYDPPYRNLFSPGDTLTVTCGKKFWISEPEHTSAVTTCGEDGEWTIRPVCQEVRCSNRRQSHVSHWDVYWGQIITLGETARYTCQRGYKSPDGGYMATCTRMGWRPDPLCEAVGADCRPPPKVENAFVITRYKDQYSSDSKVTYNCHANYTMVGENRIQCKNGTWEKKIINCTLAELLRCGTPPFLEDGGTKYITKSHYDHNERAEYMCKQYYTMEGDPYKTCIAGEWTGHMRCLKPCIASDFFSSFRQHNITLKSNDRKYFTHDEYIEFKCTTGVPVGEMALNQRCNSGVILLPSCQ